MKSKNPSVHIVNYEASFNNGILTKFSERMKAHLGMLGVPATISDKPDTKADINHHVNYLPYKHNPKYKGVDTLMVTHFLGVQSKLEALREGLKTAHGVCMSSQMKDELVNSGMPEDTLSIILPAHDVIPRRHQVVCILTNVYPDGCKREEMFTALFKTLDPNKWAFRIMGSGWHDILVPLVAEGLQVDYFANFDKDIHKQILDSSDYCLYFGQDEGSMAILDAAQAGLKTISTPQGFHLDIGLDYEFNTQEELEDIFRGLNHNPVERWGWEPYVKAHLTLWEKLCSKK